MYSPEKIIVVTAFSIMIALSLTLLMAFRPYSFVDNDKSKLICDKNGASFDMGPNYIYTLDNKLDSFNDEKARKLCEFNIIRDYGNFYKNPTAVNYQLKPTYAKDSSWGDAILMASVILLFGVLIVETIKKDFRLPQTSIIFVSVFAGALLFFLFFHRAATKIFCQRQIARKVVNFRNSAFKSGVIAIPGEDSHINSSIKILYEKCLQAN